MLRYNAIMRPSRDPACGRRHEQMRQLPQSSHPFRWRLLHISTMDGLLQAQYLWWCCLAPRSKLLVRRSGYFRGTVRSFISSNLLCSIFSILFPYITVQTVLSVVCLLQVALSVHLHCSFRTIIFRELHPRCILDRPPEKLCWDFQEAVITASLVRDTQQ
jgi:hypothetical protein